MTPKVADILAEIQDELAYLYRNTQEDVFYEPQNPDEMGKLDTIEAICDAPLTLQQLIQRLGLELA